MNKALQRYLDLRDKNMKELNDFPVEFAFSEKQFEEALEKLGASKEEVTSVFGAGEVMRKTDVPKYIEILKNHITALEKLMSEYPDTARAAFKYEMQIQEYDEMLTTKENILATFGFTEEFMEEHPDLKVIFGEAEAEYFFEKTAREKTTDLMPPSLEERFRDFPFGSQEDKGEDATIVVKYFNPYGVGTWLITEGEKQEDGNWLLFGFCHLTDWEWGYVSLRELEKLCIAPFNVKIERDLHISEDATVKWYCDN